MISLLTTTITAITTTTLYTLLGAQDAEIFHRNGWKFVDAPPPDNPVRPAFSQSSKWLSMNILVAGEDTVICEAQEHTLQDMLRHECGFSNVIAVPFRNVYEFGGYVTSCSFHQQRIGWCGSGHIRVSGCVRGVIFVFVAEITIASVM